MLRGFIDEAKSAAASFVDKYLARASVAVPFLVAFGFATAAAALALTERLGATRAFWVMAAGFIAIGLLAAALVTMREREAATAQQRSRDEEGGLGEIGEMASEAATHAAGRLPLTLAASLLANPSTAAAGAARAADRNMPLALLLVLVAFLLWQAGEAESGAGEEAEPGSDDTTEAAGSSGQDEELREAA